MSYGDNHAQAMGFLNRRAPWRRAAKPLVILFTLQLSGVGCAARAPELAPPTKPDEVKPYLEAYQDQLESSGITLEGAEDYLNGRADSPLPESETAAAAAAPAGISFAGQAGNAGQQTFKMVDGVAEYRIGAGDTLTVTSFLGPETPTPLSFRVLADGTIYIARFEIGEVPASGMTETELTRTLSELFRRYVPGGYVEVRIQEYNAWRATLTGEIVNTVDGGPGSYPLEGRMTVSDFVYRYGGPTPDADVGDIRILRQGNEISVDLAAVLAGSETDPTLVSGDVVQVPSIEQGSSRIFLFGEVGRPGVYTYTPGISILDAIAQAGGYTQSAKRDSVYVSRPGTAEVIPVNLDITLGAGQAATAPLLLAGDFVVVPFSPDRSQKIRDWVGIASLILSALTILELVRR